MWMRRGERAAEAPLAAAAIGERRRWTGAARRRRAVAAVWCGRAPRLPGEKCERCGLGFLLSSAVLTGVAAEETTRVRGSGLASVPFQRRRVLA